MADGRVFHRSRESGHWQVETLCPDGEVWPIDVAMVPLLQRLWDSGIETWVCCQGTTWAESVKFRGGVALRAVLDKKTWSYYWCNVGTIGSPWPAVTLLASWGLPAEQVTEDGRPVEGRRLSHTGNIVLDILAFRAWCEKNGVDTEPRWV